MGLFYGTDALTRHFVLPVDLGLKSHTHVDDLATQHWVSQSELRVIPLSHNRFRFSHFPLLDDCTLLNDYTVFYEDQSMSMVQNQLIDRMSGRGLWWGNVLVIKHDGKHARLIDMEAEDVALVDLLVAW
jgi:hypothetical protein